VTSTPRRPLSPWALTLLAAVLGGAATLAVTLVPVLQFAYRAPSLHIVLETGNALVALVAGYLVYGRFKAGSRVQDLLLACALGVVAVANLLLTALPAAAGADAELTRWVPLVVRLFGTVLLAAAALLPPSTVTRRPRLARNALLFGVSVAALVALGYALGERLPPTVDRTLPLDPSRPLVTGHPLVLAAQGVGMVLYGVAAAAFARQATRTGDEFLRWVAPACVLGALARVNYLLFPSLYSEFVYTGDLLRLGFYSLLLVGAAREVRSYWEARAQAAVLEDRRRLARDLHDGLTQELTYISAQAQQLAKRSGDGEAVERISGAAGRALDEARRAIAALTRPAEESCVALLVEGVEDVSSRYGVQAVTVIDPSAQLTVEQCDAAMRISAEAIRNAARHGQATTVDVRLDGAPLRMSICDDGQGFDPRASKRAGAFGLTSMRERAEGTGAAFRIESEPGGGTTVEVRWS
jgi:signal transduction histidine kinase